MIPPLLLNVTIKTHKVKSLKIWFPLMLLWPLFGTLYVIIIPLAVIAELILQSRGIHPLSVVFTTMEILTSLRGLKINGLTDKNDCKSTIMIEM
jgi:hypothetical protein